MSIRRIILFCTLIACVLSLLALVWTHHGDEASEMAARQKLDNVLGPNDENLPGPDINPFAKDFSPHEPVSPPAAKTPSENGPILPGFPNIPGLATLPNPLGGMLDNGVDVKESAEAYVIKVPINNPDDARNVKVNVETHHIEVSGQTGHQENGASFSSSFMQSFSTSQALLPEKMTQKTEKKGNRTELVITIPKKERSQPNRQTPPATAQPAPADDTPDSSPDENNNLPIQESEHRVI